MGNWEELKEKEKNGSEEDIFLLEIHERGEVFLFMSIQRSRIMQINFRENSVQIFLEYWIDHHLHQGW